MHKSEGFFGWSPNFSVYAPSAEQPLLNRKPDELSPAELIIYDFFSNRAHIDTLIAFWSLEEKKGKEKFNRSRSFLLKGLCDMFGDVLLEPFLEHLVRLINDKDSESSHRCAAELMAGIMRGMKHWPYDITEQLYEKLKPIIRMALNNITVDTDVFWGTCFATAAENFDPRRQYWLHEVLMEEPLRETTSFIDCSRIYCLQGPFNQHVWRMNSVSHRLLGMCTLDCWLSVICRRTKIIPSLVYRISTSVSESQFPKCTRTIGQHFNQHFRIGFEFCWCTRTRMSTNQRPYDRSGIEDSSSAERNAENFPER